MTGRPSAVDDLRVIADYQFGRGAGDGLFPEGEPVDIERSRSGRPRQIIADAGRIATLTTAGLLNLGLEGGRRLQSVLPCPTYRVVVGDETEPHVRDGRNVFAKFVRDVDPAVRPGDEVLIVHPSSGLIGVGRASLSADAMAAFETGMAVSVREGAPPTES